MMTKNWLLVLRFLIFIYFYLFLIFIFQVVSGHPDKVEEQAPTVVEAVSVEDLNNPEYEDVPQEAQARSADYDGDDLLGILFFAILFLFLQPIFF